LPPHHATSEGWFRRSGTIASASRRIRSTYSGSSLGVPSNSELDCENSCQTISPSRSHVS
jgi:hypothetical protein